MSKSSIAPAILCVALAVPLLGGCISTSKSAAIAPLSSDWMTGGRVEEVVFDAGDLKGVSPEFSATFKTNVKAKLAACAKGDRPLRLEATISTATKANKALVIVLGAGRSSVAGHAKLMDAMTGATVGEYDIGRKVYGARPAMFVMLDGERQLSNAFGDELCDRAFKPQAVTAK
jgi:hypothetical protein